MLFQAPVIPPQSQPNMPDASMMGNHNIKYNNSNKIKTYCLLDMISVFFFED
jgi:hypothetical protein